MPDNAGECGQHDQQANGYQCPVMPREGRAVTEQGAAVAEQFDQAECQQQGADAVQGQQS